MHASSVSLHTRRIGNYKSSINKRNSRRFDPRRWKLRVATTPGTGGCKSPPCKGPQPFPRVFPRTGQGRDAFTTPRRQKEAPDEGRVVLAHRRRERQKFIKTEAATAALKSGKLLQRVYTRRRARGTGESVGDYRALTTLTRTRLKGESCNKKESLEIRFSISLFLCLLV